MICPRCDGQGVIYKAILINKQVLLFICDECEATWLDKDRIELANFIDFSTFLEINGLKYEESEIENQGYVF